MKATILYDNETAIDGLIPDWGFSTLIETGERKILFDTGAKGDILLRNMTSLGIDPAKVDEVFISHSHWDHTGGLGDFLKINPCDVYVPLSCQSPSGADSVIRVGEPIQMHENIFSTGELGDFEQSLVVRTSRGLVLVAGCSHPGVACILESASPLGKVTALMGGLHGFNDFGLIRDLDRICPTHCTQYQAEIKALYPEKFLEGGVGRVITL